ncbi:MAG: CoA-binding protein [Promethearchaeota archaeon]
MNNDSFDAINYMFNPRNIVIFEASEKLWYFFNGLTKLNFDLNKLYLINPSIEEVFGLKCYKSITEIPEKEIDHLILAVRREKLIKSLKDLLKQKPIKTIHIFTAGTGETGKEGLEIEKEIIKILNDDKVNTRVIGPNCMGVYSTKGHISYSDDFPIEPGNIALIFQSGDVHTKLIKYSSLRYNLKFSKGVSVGNCVDLQISDFLQYFNNDDDTDLIGVYFEGFSKLYPKEGKKLLDTLKLMKKPVLFMNGGKTNRAQKAAFSHTGSIGTSEKIWDAVFKQTPTIEVSTSLDDMIDYMYLFYNLINREDSLKSTNKRISYPEGKNALIILWSGGFGVIAANMLTEQGLNLPYFEGKTLEKLRKIYPLKIGSLSNPLDLPWIVHTNEYVELSKAAISENIDLVIIQTDAWRDMEEERFQAYYRNLIKIKEYVETLKKIFIIILPEFDSEPRRKLYNMLIREKFIVYPSVRRAAKAFLALYNYGKKIKAYRD